MRVFSSTEEVQGALTGTALCLGNFDGVHRGHRGLFLEAKKFGSVAVLTFQPHPGQVLMPMLAPKLIATPSRKLELLAEAHVQMACVQPFSLEYAKTSPVEFEATLFEILKVRAVVVGHDFTYGAKRAGTLLSLEKAAATAGACLSVVSAVTVDGVVVSSSKIREFILEGRIEAAAQLLGRSFDLDGVVVKGAGRGRTIGFPTANIDTSNELKPAPGVYAVRVRNLASHLWHPGAANIGVKPTFGGGEVTIEAHLFEFQGDLYGQQLRVEFLQRLRPEKRFSSGAELAAQIARDVEAAKLVLARS
jgi:riboflavin kinase / FMN adenylyltransferase